MKKKFALLFTTSLFILSCSNPGNSYEQMIDSFNRKFFEEDYVPPEEYSIENSSFKENEMLDDTFSFPTGYLIILEAPKGQDGCNYEWKAIVPQLDESGKEILKENVIGTSKTLKFTTPGVFSTDKENKLVLTVTEQSGKIYKDTATVFITSE